MQVERVRRLYAFLVLVLCMVEHSPAYLRSPTPIERVRKGVHCMCKHFVCLPNGMISRKARERKREENVVRWNGFRLKP